MSISTDIHEVDPSAQRGALSIYQQDGGEEFPVLKAFQQYIDSEQAKARKRMVSLAVFFGFMMALVISVFVLLLLKISERNQTLNDRLVEYAMKERERAAAVQPTPAPVVVQPPQPAADNSAILTLTEKLTDMQKQLADSEAKAARAREEAVAAIAKARRDPTPEEREIVRLKEQLKAAREQAESEKAKKREAELEAYRRQHYPELYAPKVQQVPQRTKPGARKVQSKVRYEGADNDTDLDDDDAISYFDDDDDLDEPAPKTRARAKAKAKTKTKAETKAVADEAKARVTAKPAATAPARPATSGGWQIPED